MGTVVAPADVLAVGKPEYNSAGQLLGWSGSPHWIVEFAGGTESANPHSWERLALAVGKASRQFMNIDELGNVVPDDELGLTGRYTPSYVSDPDLSAFGVSVQVDTQGSMTVQMGEALLRVLVAELGRLPFDTRVSRVETGSPGVRWRPPYLERGEPQVIARAVRCVLHNGVPDVTIEYFDTQGGWTTSSADAQVFERDEHGTHSETWNFALRLTLSMFEEA